MIEFTRSISSTRIGQPVLMIDVKFFKDKDISRWVDRENLIYGRQNRAKAVDKDKEGDQQRERRQALSEVKPFKNINKNLRSFLEISPTQKEVFVSPKLQDHAYRQQNPLGLIRFPINNIRTKASNISKAKPQRVMRFKVVWFISF